MDILIPVIGIPNCFWKKKVVKYARNNPHIIELEGTSLCYDCDRHRELLKMFDEGDTDYKNSRYFHYSIKNSGKTEEVTLKKIVKFKKMYLSMKKGVYECPKDRIPIITEDGCRLDGSHKLTILEHIGCKKVDVNIVIYGQIFPKSEVKKILKDNIKYRKKVYRL